MSISKAIYFPVLHLYSFPCTLDNVLGIELNIFHQFVIVIFIIMCVVCAFVLSYKERAIHEQTGTFVASRTF